MLKIFSLAHLSLVVGFGGIRRLSLVVFMIFCIPELGGALILWAIFIALCSDFCAVSF